MGLDLSNHAGYAAQANGCRLVVGKQRGLSEILQFVMAGLEIGQQVVIVAGPPFLNDVARGLTENGLRPDVFLHSGRLVFLTAPDCLNELLRAGDPSGEVRCTAAEQSYDGLLTGLGPFPKAADSTS